MCLSIGSYNSESLFVCHSVAICGRCFSFPLPRVIHRNDLHANTIASVDFQPIQTAILLRRPVRIVGERFAIDREVELVGAKIYGQYELPVDGEWKCVGNPLFVTPRRAVVVVLRIDGHEIVRHEARIEVQRVATDGARLEQPHDELAECATRKRNAGDCDAVA